MVGYWLKIFLVWIAAIAFVPFEAMLFRKYSLLFPIGFWMLFASIMVVTFPIFYRIVTGKLTQKFVGRIFVAAGLSLVTYFIAINGAYMVALLVYGD